MGRLRQMIVGVIALVLVATAISFLFVGAIYVAAIVAPILGLAYAAYQASAARELWRSGGHFPLADDVVRIIEPGRARTLGLLALLNGVGGLLVTLLVPALVFGYHALVIPALGGGLALVLGTNAGRRRLMASTHPIDILPPE